MKEASSPSRSLIILSSSFLHIYFFVCVTKSVFLISNYSLPIIPFTCSVIPVIARYHCMMVTIIRIVPRYSSEVFFFIFHFSFFHFPFSIFHFPFSIFHFSFFIFHFSTFLALFGRFLVLPCSFVACLPAFACSLACLLAYFLIGCSLLLIYV